MRPTIISLLLFALSSAGASAGGVAMCLEKSGTTEAQCACAEAALIEEIGADDAGIYDRVGTRYLESREAGQSMGDSWDAAIAATAAEIGVGRTALLTRMNVAGKAHRGAIKACE
ncbi:hypothetical protein ACEWPM_007945 [Roseovarius sp. S4756]|uniref:hypothetical protein n=1 Tax=Roseovarius maritimus TaxID=3342637 RepID=UPI003727D3FF